MKICFNCDYMAGAHPEVLRRLCETNLDRTAGYGNDPYTAEARKLILEKCGLTCGEVYFLTGGTQTNKIVIDRLLSRNDGVLCCDSGHINIHESGAIEADGHKVLPLSGKDGKISALQISKYVEDFYKDETHIHIVRPSMVYISFPTEYGTLYSLDELTEISDVCKEFNLPLFIDGARLAYGLASEASDITLKDIARLADVFYIGGTKCGALFGEAVVTRRPELLPRFDSLMKLHGGLMAKGRLLSIQFITLFTDDLYLKLGEHADRLAMKLKEAFIRNGYKEYIESFTNQQFFVMANDKIEELKRYIGFDYWGPPGEKESVIRFVTDWSTTESDVDRLIQLLE